MCVKLSRRRSVWRRPAHDCTVASMRHCPVSWSRPLLISSVDDRGRWSNGKADRRRSARLGRGRSWWSWEVGRWPDIRPSPVWYSKKVAHTRLPSVGFRSWSRFLAVSLQVTWVINPAVGCYYFPPGLQLHPQPLRGLLPVLLLGEQRHSLPKTVTRHSVATAIWTQALLHLSPER